jgi:hypothetical protein
MVRYLHTLSAILFYVIGASVFLAYLLWSNNIATGATLRWLQTADLPLLCTALLFGGMSIYRSMTTDKPSKVLGISLTVVFALLFIVSAVVKFAFKI